MKLGVKVIQPAVFVTEPSRYKRVIENQLNMAAVAVQADFNVTTQTWKRRPHFYIIFTKDKGQEGRKIYTESDIYRFVSGGTRIRYATMTPGFIAKTRPNWLGSRPGRGGLAYVSKLRPRPGIKARRFSENIAEKWMKRWPMQLSKALQTEARAIASGH